MYRCSALALLFSDFLLIFSDFLQVVASLPDYRNLQPRDFDSRVSCGVHAKPQAPVPFCAVE